MSNPNNPYFDDFDNYEDCETELKPKCCEAKNKCCPKHRGVTVLQAVSLIQKTVLASGAVPFDTNLVVFGTGIIHGPGSAEFNLISAGIYRVTVVASVDPSTLNVAGIALAVSGSIIPGTTITETVAAGSTASLTTQTIIQVPPYISTVLTVVNPTAGTEVFTNPNIIIEKLN